MGEIGSYSKGISNNIQDLQLGSAGHGPLPLMNSDSTSSTQSVIFMNMETPSPSPFPISSSQPMRETTVERSTNSSTYLGRFLHRDQTTISGIPNLSSCPVISSSPTASCISNTPSFDERTSYDHPELSNGLTDDMHTPLLGHLSSSSSSSHSYMKPDELIYSGSGHSNHDSHDNHGNHKEDNEYDELSRSIDFYSIQDENSRNGRRFTQFGTRQAKPINLSVRDQVDGQSSDSHLLPTSSYTPGFFHLHGHTLESYSPTHGREVINDLTASQPTWVPIFITYPTFS